MDLLQSVRKEGSRGGRANFSWDDVKADQHRENYLGHSLMAPVGRWQKNKDLSWYARTDSSAGQTEEERKQAAADARKEEIRKIKEAEEDALARALGYEVPDRKNPNLTELGSQKEMERKIKETVDEDADDSGERGLGFGAYDGGKDIADNGEDDVLEGTRGLERGGVDGRRDDGDRERSWWEESRRPTNDRHRDRRHRRRSKSVDRERERHRRRSRDRDRPRERSPREARRRHSSRSRSRSRTRRRSREPHGWGRDEHEMREPAQKHHGRNDLRHDDRHRRRRSASAEEYRRGRRDRSHYP